MSVMSPVKIKNKVQKINRSHRLGAAIAPCLQALEPRVLFSVPTFAFSAPAFYTSTVPAGGENVTITVNRTVDTTDPVSVSYATSNGTSNANAIDTTAV